MESVSMVITHYMTEDSMQWGNGFPWRSGADAWGTSYVCFIPNKNCKIWRVLVSSAQLH